MSTIDIYVTVAVSMLCSCSILFGASYAITLHIRKMIVKEIEKFDLWRAEEMIKIAETQKELLNYIHKTEEYLKQKEEDIFDFKRRIN